MLPTPLRSCAARAEPALPSLSGWSPEPRSRRGFERGLSRPGRQQLPFTSQRSPASTAITGRNASGRPRNLTRWLSPDPIGEAGGVNLYAYVENNPGNHVDPTGETAILLWPAMQYLGSLGVSGLVSLGLWDLGTRLSELADDQADAGKKCQGKAIDGETDLADTSTWPRPPVDGPLKEGAPSRSKPAKRGEKSLYDEKGGEWRPHKPDAYHPEGHWDHRPSGGAWQNVPV